MSNKNFIGRGRGWLNLNTNNISNDPGKTPQPTKSIIKCVKEDNIFVGASKYEYLFNVVKQLNTDDDSVKFNSATKKVNNSSLNSLKGSFEKASKNLCGRGRGWLSLNEIDNNAPGNLQQPTVPVGGPPQPIIQCVNEDDIFVDAPEYEFLVNGVKLLDMDDDVIKFNQKVRYLLEKWKEDCSTSDEVEKSFQTLYQASLYDDDLASKLVYLISSNTFITQEVQDKHILSLFLSQLQKTLEQCGSLHKTDPMAFKNCTRMLGEFFSKGRLINGGSFSFMAAPLVVNLRILLDNAHPENLQLLATQLFVNGVRLRAACPELFTKLLNDARITLISNELKTESKLWLLLCIGGADNEFRPFSADSYKFYEDHIGEAATAIIQKASSKPSVQTSRDNKLLDGYQSNANVTKDFSAAKSSQFSDAATSNPSQEYTSGLVSDSSSHNSSTNYRGTVRISRKPCVPIGGVGVRFNSCNIDTEASSKGGWGDKSNVNVLQEASTDRSSQFPNSFTISQCL